MPEETLKQVVDRVKAAKTAIGNAIVAKGGTVSSGDGLEEYPVDIATINTNTTSINITENGTYYAGEETTVTTSSLPITIYDSVGLPITHVTVEGNMEQTGTPTPTTPIQPQECGDRTGNLLNADIYYSAFKNGDSYTATTSQFNNTFIRQFTATDIGKTFTMSCEVTDNQSDKIYWIGMMGGTQINGNVVTGTGLMQVTVTVVSTNDYLKITYGNQNANITVKNIMLNTGSTLLPYEPYGYKIPISSNSTTTPVYLGEVQATRKIKKLVLDGTEGWKRDDATGVFNCGILNSLSTSSQSGISSHWPFEKNRGVYTLLTEGHGCIRSAYNELWIRDNNFPTVADFKAFLQQQYAAGTPVTVWYVLATEETGIVNEPLRKIGDYADELSINTSIPLSQTTQNIIDINTTLKPSSSSFTYRQKNEYIGYNEINVNVEPKSVSPKDVNFYDYDGTCVYSYTADEFAELTEMPANPTHAGLTSQGWNWDTIANVKAYVAKYGMCNIGQSYSTSDGKTRIYITLGEGRLHPYLGLYVNGSVDVDWGDGSVHSTMTGSSATSTIIYADHTYSTPGDYVIALDVTGTFGIPSANSASMLLNANSTVVVSNRPYLTSVTKINIGNNISALAATAFAQLTCLKNITIPNSITSISTTIFSSCTSIPIIIIPQGTEQLQHSFMQYSTGVEYIILPNSIRTLGEADFYSCTSIKKSVIS